MPVTQPQPIFTTEEAERFAALWAGFDIGNASEAEAMGKARLLRRMVAGKGVRLVDAFELAEIRAALDAQMQPARQPLANLAEVAVLEEKLQNLEEQLGEALDNNQILTDALARVQGRSQQNGSFTGPLLSGFLALALAAECVLAVAGLFGGRATPRAAPIPERASIAAAVSIKASAIEPGTRIEPATKRELRPKPVPVVPEEPFGEEKPVVAPASRQPLHWQELWKALQAKGNPSKRPVVPESQF